MSAQEPAEPQRGQTAEERGPDVSEAQAELGAQETMAQRVVVALKPGFLLSQAEAYPVGVKQFLQFCLLLIYPGWIFAVLVMWFVYGCFWLLFWPLRAWMKRNRPEDYAASQLK